MNSTRLLLLCSLLFFAACQSKEKSQSAKIETDDVLILKAELAYEIPSLLGEGALWSVGLQQLWWVDIEGKKLNLYHPSTNQNQSFDMPSRIGTVVEVANEDRVIVALEDGLYFFDWNTNTLEFIINPEASKPDLRFNDGKCDPQGRFWVGSMHMNQTTGAAGLYRLNRDLTVYQALDQITISNGIVWTSDHKTMYYIDTPTGKVMGYDYDPETGAISNPRVAVEIPQGTGHPDGMAIDVEDKIWVAHWGGAAVYRYDPLTGKTLLKVEVPALNITSVAFTGPELKTLLITSASVGMDENQVQNFPLAGSLFTVEVDVKGCTFSLFKEFY
jgi:sugar lactone lactonase YvrE